MLTPGATMVDLWRAGISRPSDTEFRELLEQLPAAAYTTDADGLITYFNTAAVELWGRSPALRNRADRYCGSFRLFAPDGEPIDHGACWMARALRENRAYTQREIVVERPDGTRRTALAHANPIHDGDGRLIGAVNVLLDITDRKAAEVEAREASEAKTRFLAVLAHELRNPLAPMRSAVDLLGRTHDEAAREQATATLDRQLRHLTRIVADLLDIARVTRNALELDIARIDLAEVIDHAVETCRPSVESRRQEVRVTAAGEPIEVDGDRDRLAQLIGNLLSNASKYSGEGAPIEVIAHRTESEAVVSVRDRGRGIEPELLDAMFEMFRRGENAPQDGLGVGLTLAQHLAGLHGGSIEARSSGPGEGSEFRVHLPLADATASARPGTSVPEATYRHQRILVVDDNRDAADVLAELLALEENETHVAHDGAAAVQLARELRPDAIVLDIGLPELDGYEAARRIRALPEGDRPTLIALSGWGQAQDRARSREAGFDHHLVKPVDFAALVDLLAQSGRNGTAGRMT